MNRLRPTITSPKRLTQEDKAENVTTLLNSLQDNPWGDLVVAPGERLDHDAILDMIQREQED